MPPDPSILQEGALCTLDDVVERTPGYTAGDDTDVDAVLNELIIEESQDFLEVTGREIIAANDDAVRVFELDWFVAEERELLIGDAATVTAVDFKQQDGTLVQTLDASAWVKMPRVRKAWQPITSLAFPAGVASPAVLPHRGRNILGGGSLGDLHELAEVTGTWGYPAIPDTVKRAVATFVLFRYLNDVASAGTQLADLANKPEFNLAASLRVALDTRDRMRVARVG
jgi:hypothetical protein